MLNTDESTIQLPATIKPEDVTAVIDSREQQPLDLSPLASVSATLQVGDYTIKGLEHMIAIERKSEGDLLTCCGQDRARFDQQIQRLLGYPVRAVVIQSTWPRIEAGEWKSQVQPESVLGTLLGIVERGLPVVMAGNHERAGRYVSRLLYVSARRRYRELRALLGNVAPCSRDGL